MHLAQHREHHQPRHGNRNKAAGVAVTRVPRGSQRRQCQHGQIQHAQCPFRRDGNVARSKFMRPQRRCQRPSDVVEQTGQIIAGADEEIRVMLAAIEKTDL